MLKIATAPLGEENQRQASRALLARLYASVTGQEMPAIAVAPRGKPYFLSSPYHFSITHTKNRVFVALSDRPVGIDAEQTTRQVNPKLAEKILSQSEYAIYCAAPEEKRNELLLRFWVLKEAEVKCSGLGLRGYPNHTDFDPYDKRITLRNGCFVAVIQPKEETHAL